MIHQTTKKRFRESASALQSILVYLLGSVACIHPEGQTAFTEARNDPSDDEEARDDPADDEEVLPRKRFRTFSESASDATHPAVFAAC